MSSSPVRSQALKGALIAIDPSATLLVASDVTVFAFQYNPEQLTRSVSYFNADGTPVADAKVSVQGSPVEFFNLTLELDAADQLEHPEQNASVARNGLSPALATLDSLMVSSESVAKVVLFWWGPNRLLPTRLVSVRVSEQAFDLGLNPIRASVDLCLRVMTLGELKSGSVGYNVCRNQLFLDGKLASLYKDSIGTTVLSQVSSQIVATSQTTSVSSSSAAMGVSSSSNKVNSPASAAIVSTAKKPIVKSIKSQPKT